MLVKAVTTDQETAIPYPTVVVLVVFSLVVEMVLLIATTESCVMTAITLMETAAQPHVLKKISVAMVCQTLESNAIPVFSTLIPLAMLAEPIVPGPTVVMALLIPTRLVTGMFPILHTIFRPDFAVKIVLFPLAVTVFWTIFLERSAMKFLLVVTSFASLFAAMDDWMETSNAIMESRTVTLMLMLVEPIAEILLVETARLMLESNAIPVA